MATTKSKPKKATRKKRASKTSGSKASVRQKSTGDESEMKSTPKQPDDSQSMVVFAFRLTRAERDLIHQAAGSAKAFGGQLPPGVFPVPAGAGALHRREGAGVRA